MKEKLQRGQALILIALAFVGLAAFIGLAVDAGILYTNIGHLRRAVDASSLAAANQFKEGLTLSQIEASAKEFLDLNNLDSATADVYVCEESINPGGPYGPHHDGDLCRCEDDTDTWGDADCDEASELDHRKLVRVEGVLPVEFAFLPIVGFNSIDIRADAISETAALDLMLVVDSSASMAFDLCSDGINNDPSDDGVTDDCQINDPPNQAGSISENDVDRCVANNDCEPFESVRTAAQFMVDRMYFPFDRMGVVKYSQFGTMELALQDGDDWSSVTAALNSIDVDNEPDPHTWCPDWFTVQNPAGCTSTNVAAGIRAANQELANNGREEAVWLMIVLSDGAANAAQDDSSPPQWLCPGSTDNPNWIKPFCRDYDPDTRHDSTHADYDPDDRARDMADLAGCLPAPNQASGCPGSGGNGVVIFTIGLGDQVTNNDDCDNSYYSAAECNEVLDQGEQLLRYIANVGADGDPDPASDACDGVGVGTDCGNYYYSPTGSGVLRVFEAIASRIFTRITH